jgi:hypothetical protein
MKIFKFRYIDKELYLCTHNKDYYFAFAIWDDDDKYWKPFKRGLPFWVLRSPIYLSPEQIKEISYSLLYI